MAIRTVVTRGYANGSFTTNIALVVLRGYNSGVVGPVEPTGGTAMRKWCGAQGGKGVVKPQRGW